MSLIKLYESNYYNNYFHTSDTYDSSLSIFGKVLKLSFYTFSSLILGLYAELFNYDKLNK